MKDVFIFKIKPNFLYFFIYRCRIPECDSNNTNEIEYTPLWISNAVPVKNNKPSFCKRYKPNINDTEKVILENECPSILFTKKEITCNTSELVFPNKHTTIANDVSNFNHSYFVFSELEL